MRPCETKTNTTNVCSLSWFILFATGFKPAEYLLTWMQTSHSYSQNGDLVHRQQHQKFNRIVSSSVNVYIFIDINRGRSRAFIKEQFVPVNLEADSYEWGSGVLP